MKYSIPLFLIAALSLRAAAIGPATSQQRDVIQGYLDKAKDIQERTDGINDKKKLLDAAEKAIDRKEATVVKLKSEIAELEKQCDVARTVAIHLTIKAFDLAPVDSSGRLILPKGKVVMNGAFKSREILWIPVSGKNEARLALNERGKVVTVPPAGDAPIAFTATDGVTRLFDGSYTSPGLLAATLLHERTHFEQFTSAGTGDKLTYNQRELKALEAERDARYKLGLNSEELQRQEDFLIGDPSRNIRGALDKWRELVRDEARAKPFAWPWGGGRGAPEAFPSAPGTYKDLKDRSDSIEAELLSAENEMLAKIAQQKREAELSQQAIARPYNGGLPEGVVPAAPYKPGGDHAAAMPVPIDLTIERVMKKIGRSACSVPVAPFDSDLAGIMWSSFRKDFDYQSQETGMSACELRVYRRLVNFGRTWSQGAKITPDEIRAEGNVSSPSTGGGGGRGGVIPPKQDHNDVWRKFPTR
ncbi:MAG: hypothetical protein HY923_07255 [Elusimicrobia bacterium]|nr:hypothetical protein [Elusimicrobiota bacterium]